MRWTLTEARFVDRCIEFKSLDVPLPRCLTLPREPHRGKAMLAVRFTDHLSRPVPRPSPCHAEPFRCPMCVSTWPDWPSAACLFTSMTAIRPPASACPSLSQGLMRSTPTSKHREPEQCSWIFNLDRRGQAPFLWARRYVVAEQGTLA